MGTEEFNDPLKLLQTHHQLILTRCDELEALAETAPDERPTQRVANDLERFFSSIITTHHADELELFNRLNHESLKLADLIHTLKQDHAELEQQ